MRSLAIIVLASLLAWVALPARAEVSARVDRSVVGSGETVDLVLRSGSVLGGGDPDLSPLADDFEILGNAQSSNISIVNGRRTAFTEWRVTLMPKREGRLRIPAIRIGDETTQPIDITVSAGGSAPDTAPGQDVRVEVDLDQPRVHVQQQVLVTVRLLHAINLGRGASLDEPEIPSAVLRKLGENSYEKDIGGRHYGVFERRYAVFPQQSGELTIPALRFEAQLGGGMGWFDTFGTRGRTLRLRSEPRTITVLPPEPGSATWLPARVVTLVETWDKSPNQLHVGESATRTLTITANGLTGAQLPPLPPPAVDGLRFYADQPKITDTPTDSGISGARAESTAVIPTRAGDIEFPEVRLRWWDTQKQRFDEAIVPAKTIRVLPAAGSAPTAPSPAPSATPAPAPQTNLQPATAPTTAPDATAATTPGPPWPWIALSALLALATLVSSLQWWRLARRPRPAPAPEPVADPREKDLFRQLREACNRGDATRVEALLLDWARVAFPDARLINLSRVIAFAADAELDAALQSLLRSRYARAEDGASWNGTALLSRLEALRERARVKPRAAGVDPLPPLYG